MGDSGAMLSRVGGSSWGLLAGIAVLGGMTGSLVTVAFRLTSEPERATPVSAAEEESTFQNAEDEEGRLLRRKLTSLEHRVSLLTRALAERGLGGEERERGGPLDPEEVDVADPVFEAAVLDIFDRQEERKDEERQSRREELRTKRSQAMADELGERIELDAAQRAKISSIVMNHFREIRALRDSDDRPLTRNQWRETMETLQREAETQIRESMSAAQLDAYDALDPDDQISLGWGRGRSRSSRETQPKQQSPNASE